MFAIVESGGKQIRVTPDAEIYIEKLDAKEGDTFRFEKILMIDQVIGNPYLANAKVEGKVIKQGKNRKIIVLKFKSKKHYKRKYGHRQLYTKVKITKIETQAGANNG